MQQPVYLDYNATTPVDERVLERMLPYFSERFGNPSSEGHAAGWIADEAVTQAREALAELLGAVADEIVFTGGATEAINLAIKGVAAVYGRKGRHIITAATEHSAVLETCRALEKQGYAVTVLPVDAAGRVSPGDVEAALTDETILVCVMWANNETGTIQPVEEIAQRVRSRGALFMTDATQAIGKLPVAVDFVDLLACSAHKFYGPKGVGALYVRRRGPRVRLVPLVDGGGQEGGRRGGTVNVPGVVGMGAAAEIVRMDREKEVERLRRFRDLFERTVLARVPDARVNAREAERLGQTSSITFPGRRADNMMMSLRSLALSAGSACASGKGAPSHVLKAMGLSDEEALSTLRISLGRYTDASAVETAAGEIAAAALGRGRRG